MTNSSKAPTSSPESALFGRVVSILDQARNNVVRAVNSQMVLAYWLIGREIVESIQGGEERAAYGKRIVADLSRQLTQHFGKGFSVSNLWYFRQFYLAFSDRQPIPHPLGGESFGTDIPHPLGGESLNAEVQMPQRGLAKNSTLLGFSPQLTWSHYRALMQVTDLAARDFYEHEAAAGCWDKRTLERQIHSFYYERTLKSSQPSVLLAEGRALAAPTGSAVEALKNPYVFEFLGLPNMEPLQESSLEQAIITHLQRFLLELGNGFAFVARQKHIRIEEQDRFIDLVFYHCQLKFYLLIDLKLTSSPMAMWDRWTAMCGCMMVCSLRPMITQPSA